MNVILASGFPFLIGGPGVFSKNILVVTIGIICFFIAFTLICVTSMMFIFFIFNIIKDIFQFLFRPFSKRTTDQKKIPIGFHPRSIKTESKQSKSLFYFHLLIFYLLIDMIAYAAYAWMDWKIFHFEHAILHSL